MKLRILSIGGKPPAWVRDGFEEYAKRMPKEMALSLLDIPAPRHGSDLARSRQLEGKKIIEQIRAQDWVIALDEHGKPRTSVQLAQAMAQWRGLGQDLVFCIGGADGLSEPVLERANETLSLSHLTLPHYMVRVVLAEALYRAWSINMRHPYHRE